MKISQPQKDLWDFIRKKKTFTALEALGEKKNRTLEVYINALERAKYIEQTKTSIYPIKREYKLILDTGELPPIYRTARKSNPEIVIDRNIDRECIITGIHVKKVNALEAKIEKIVKNDGFFDYEKIKTMFKDETKHRGYNYTLLDYYKKKLG